MGLRLRNPLIASTSPLTGVLDNIRSLEDSGAAAVVLPSLFEEQIRHEQEGFAVLKSIGNDSFAEALSYFPAQVDYAVGPDQYLDLIRSSAEAVHIPVIGSLNGISREGWIDYARLIDHAGASALELNVYFIPADLSLSAEGVERRYLAIVEAVKQAVSIPVAVKIGPHFSAVGAMAKRLEAGGADALVLFNRFYQPDIDLARLHFTTDLALSTPAEIRLPLLWIAVLHGRMKVSLAATTGVGSADEVIKYLLVGADAVMTTSSLLRHGVQHMRALLAGVTQWLDARGFASVTDIRGLTSQRRVRDPTALERANYIKILSGFPRGPSPDDAGTG
jgi:dihydroorotate dehydrogenase (fumarate)